MLYARLALVVALSLVVAIVTVACAVRQQATALDQEISIHNPWEKDAPIPPLAPAKETEDAG